MDGLFNLLKSIIAMPFEKLRMLLKRKQMDSSETNDVLEGGDLITQSDPGVEELVSNKVVINQSSGGIVIIPNALAIGERRAMGKIDESMEFRYIGKVQNGKDKMDVLTHDNYPFMLIPQTGTSILGCNAFEGIVSGVSEPKLFEALKKLKKIETEIEVIQNVSLPIKKRNYGYKPDIAVLWKSKGIAIDVEIDEPYDIKSREPIHCTDDEKDYIRNAYFLENGWFVIRIAEEQVIKNVDGIYGYVSKIISTLTKDERFANDCSIDSVMRWTKEEAQKMAADGYREKYLDLKDEIKESTSDENSDDGYIAPQNFDFKKPTIEIIANRYDELSNEIRGVAENHAYVRIKRSEDGYEYITTKELIKYSPIGVTFKDVVEDKKFYLPYANIDSYNGLDTIKIEKGDIDWQEFIYDTMVQCRPIHIKYEKTSENYPTERDVFYIVPYIKNRDAVQRFIEQYSEMGWLRMCSRHFYESLSNLKSMTIFSGYCSYRKELRMFNYYRILNGYAYDCYKPLVKHDTNEVLRVLEKGDGRLAEIIYTHFTNEEKNNYANIANNGHALVLQRKYEEALKYYFRFPEGKIIFDKVTWRQALLEDIENFSKNEKYGAKFDHVKKLIYDNDEWHSMK